MQNTVKIRPEMNKSLIVNVLLVYAIKLGGVEEGNKKEQLQQIHLNFGIINWIRCFLQKIELLM